MQVFEHHQGRAPRGDGAEPPQDRLEGVGALPLRRASMADIPAILALKNAFHGRTMGTLALTGKPYMQEPFLPMVPGVEFIDSTIEALEAAIAQVRDQIGRHEGDFAQLGEMLEGEERAAQARSEEIVGRKREVEHARQSISSRVRPDILRIYAMVFSKRGNAVAEITNGVCRGCHISLPPQLYNQILRAERVHQCPNCQRILMPPASAR